jgi:hypothetical protein
MLIYRGRIVRSLSRPVDSEYNETFTRRFNYSEFWGIGVIWDWHVDLDVVCITSSFELGFNLEEYSSAFRKCK